ncbi:MAG TPA: hypothetical protein GXX73_14315 [Clostridium sp.]|nr:hypothetical protein [Clostridium sp.]
MDSIVSQITAIILAVSILFVAPAYRISWMKDLEIYKYVSNETSQFVTSARLKGYISKKMLEEYLKSLDKTGYMYDVELIHSKKVYYPLDPSHPDYTSEHRFVVEDDVYSTKTIIDTIYNDNKDYRMSIGDNFEVILRNKTKTSAMVISGYLGGSGDNMIFARCGGAIQNEDY